MKQGSKMTHLFDSRAWHIFSWNAEKLLYIDVKSKDENTISLHIFSNVSNGKHQTVIDIPTNDLALDRKIHNEIFSYLDSDPIKVAHNAIFNLRIKLDVAGDNFPIKTEHTQKRDTNFNRASAAIRDMGKQLNTHFNGEDIVNAAQIDDSKEIDLSEFPDLRTELKAYVEPEPAPLAQPSHREKKKVVLG